MFQIDDVVRGLEYLHSQEPPICHGDLKSVCLVLKSDSKIETESRLMQLNILVNWMYRAVITDFGSARRLVHRDIDPLAKQIESQSQPDQPLQATFCLSSNTITLTGNKYTLRWAAPELLSEDRLGLWSDIWALGWIAYEVKLFDANITVNQNSLTTLEIGYDQLYPVSRCLHGCRCRGTRHSRGSPVHHRQGPPIVGSRALFAYDDVLEGQSYRATEG